MRLGLTRAPITARSPGWHVTERSIALPPSGVVAARAYLRSWDLKRRAGFTVPDGSPTVGADIVIVARIGPIAVSEPVRVVWVGDGFGYATRRGHPLRGEESFVLDAAAATFTVRSIARPASFGWALLWPALRVTQRVVVRRYLRAVLDASRTGTVPVQEHGK